MTDFAASLGRNVIAITILVGVILIVVSVTLFSTLPEPGSSRSLLIGGLPLAFIAGGLLFRVSGYSLSSTGIRVHRPVRSIVIRLDSVESIESAPELMKGSVRTIGNGGLFGFYGRFWKSGLGSFRAFVTDPSHAVLIRTRQHAYALSPDEPDAFVQAVRERLEAAVDRSRQQDSGNL